MLLPTLLEQIAETLEARAANNTLRMLRGVPEGFIDFASNDYLGLLRSSTLQHGIARQIAEHATCGKTLSGAGGSRLISGQHEFVEELEGYLKNFYSSESALTFPSGFDANMAVITALGELKDVVLLYDEKVHASMRDGFRLAKARSYHFRHNDLSHLEELLKGQTKRTIIFVESVYSMDGDIAPLKELLSLTTKYGGEVVLDEAHSGGVFGEQGRGLGDELNVAPHLFARIFPWGKGYGCQGGTLVGPQKLKDLVINFGRHFIYSTGVSPLLAISALSAYQFARECDSERAALQALIKEYAIQAAPFSPFASQNPSPIQTLTLPRGENMPQRLQELSKKLRAASLLAVPIFHPTVPMGEERIRISLHAFNSGEEIRKLFQLYGAEEKYISHGVGRTLV